MRCCSGGLAQCHPFLASHLLILRTTEWNYTIMTDPTRTSASQFSPLEHTGDVEGFFLPLQMSIDNALTGASDVPEAFSFTSMDQATRDRESRDQFLQIATYILSFVFFASMMMVCHHVSSMITSERESGLSELIDAMSGGAAWPRIASYMIVFDLLYLPLWIILGCRESSSAAMPPLKAIRIHRSPF